MSNVRVFPKIGSCSPPIGRRSSSFFISSWAAWIILLFSHFHSLRVYWSSLGSFTPLIVNQVLSLSSASSSPLLIICASSWTVFSGPSLFHPFWLQLTCCASVSCFECLVGSLVHQVQSASGSRGPVFLL